MGYHATSTLSRIFFFSFLYAFFLPAHSQDNFPAEPSEEALENLMSAIEDVQADISKRRNERSSLYNILQETEKSLSQVSSRIREIDNDIETNETLLTGYTGQRAELEKEKASQLSLIRQYLRSAHQAGKQEYFKLLLNQENPALLSRTLQYYRYFSEARSEKITDFTRTIREIEALESEIAVTTLKLNEQQQALAQQQANLEDASRERQSLLDELDATLSSSNRKLESLEAQRAEMEILLEELRQSIANLSLGEQEQAFTELRGRLPWPVKGRILNSFGSSYGLGDLDWQGITIAAQQGSAVRAIHHGRVVFSDWFSSSGLLLIIDHGGGYMSLYAHNQELYKEVGEWVRSGETIASVGNTGGQEDSSLYFEIRHDGESQNPSTWLTRN